MDTPTSTTNRLKEFGNWSEQISSSGKRYYYNSVSNVSQWEKPPEWKQAEKLRASSSSVDKNGNSLPIKNESERASPISTTTIAKINKTTPAIREDKYQKHSYNNSVSNIPQWEKPSEWKQAEKLRATSSNVDKNGNSLSIKNENERASPVSTTTITKINKITPGFREDKYQKHWRPEMAILTRRSLGFEVFANDLKKCADKSQKHKAGIFALDRDIHSIRTLYQTAQLRTRLLKQRLDAVRERIQQLDCKGQ